MVANGIPGRVEKTMIKQVLKYVIKDTTDVLMVIAMIVISVLDFVTDIGLP